MSHAAEINEIYKRYDKILDAYQNGQIDDHQAVEYTATIVATDGGGTRWGVNPHRELWAEDPSGHRVEPANPENFVPHANMAVTDPHPQISETVPYTQINDASYQPQTHSTSPTPTNLFTVAGIKDTVLGVLSRWKDFSGTATRGEFWTWTLTTFVVAFIVNVLTLNLINLGAIGAVLSLVLFLAIFIPSISLTVRRTRDVGLPPLLGLLIFAPLLNLIVVGWCIAPGQSKR